MRVLLVGNSEETSRLAQLLEGQEMALERRADDSEPPGGPEEIAAIAKELREFERALSAGGPDAVLVASDSSASLAAVLVATKRRKPVAAIDHGGRAGGGVNARLIRQLADAELAPEPVAISNWLRDTYTERP